MDLTGNRQLRYHARSEGSEGTMSCLRVPGEETTQDVTITSWTTCAQKSFHGSIQTAVTDEVSSVLVGTRSVSVRAVSRSVERCVLCPSRAYHNQRVVRLKRHKEKLDWNNTSVATLLSGNKYAVS